MLPAYLGYLGGTVTGSVAGQSNRRTMVFNGLFFVAGFSVVVVILGIVATLVGQTFKSVIHWVTIVAGIGLLLLGLHQMRLIRLKWLAQLPAAGTWEGRFKSGYLRSFFAGILIAPGWGITFLGSILLIAATTGTVAENIIRLLAYAIGFGLVFMVFFFAAAPVSKRLANNMHWFARIEKAAGAVVVIIALFMISDKLTLISQFATWSGKKIIHGFLGVG